MKIQVISEHGYQQALLGITLNKGCDFDRAKELAPKLAKLDGGHNKFLESIYLWIDIVAPRYWWCQADTYRISTKQSESTMHSIMKRPLTMGDFEGFDDYVYLQKLNEEIENGNFDKVKALLPESFLQERIWVMSYKTLRNVFLQRHTHKLKEWRYFCRVIFETVEHPEFLFRRVKDES